ncbi:MAG TPA: hypothetical protein VJ746_17640 [Nitrospira sp.]|nr:hypothetical protein [Nitrospira sp.]
MFINLLPSSLDAARGGGKTEVLPMQTAAPIAVVIESAGSEGDLRRRLRAKNGVAEIPAQNVRFSQAPTGSFGFIAPQPLGMALVTQSPDLTIDRTAPASNAFEVHKLADGSGMLVGFIGKDVVPQITPANRPHPVRLALHSSPSEKAPYIAAVPLVKLMVDRMPVRLEPTRADSAVVFDMDLQGTANRKSVPAPQ